MVPVFMLTLVLVIVLLVALFVYDARRARDAASADDDAAPERPSVEPATPPTPPPSQQRAEPAPSPTRPAVDAEQLAVHVRELRRAVDAELVSHDEAVDSILRQAGDRLSREAATRLLDGEAGAGTAEVAVEEGTGAEAEREVPPAGERLADDEEPGGIGTLPDQPGEGDGPPNEGIAGATPDDLSGLFDGEAAEGASDGGDGDVGPSHEGEGQGAGPEPADNERADGDGEDGDGEDGHGEDGDGEHR